MSYFETLVALYRSGEISRRVFIARLIAVAGSSSLAFHYLETTGWAESLVSPQRSDQESKSRNDTSVSLVSLRVESAAVNFPGEGATLLGYLSRPQSGTEQSLPGLLLIHDTHGLNEHIRDVARRFAAQGFFVLAPDHLSRQGGARSFPSPDDAIAACREVGDEDVLKDLEAACSYLRSHPSVEADRIGVMGFGWGGQRAFLYATVNPTLKAAVVFDGSPPPEGRLSALETPVLGLYAENAAQDSWSHAIAFLKKHLASRGF